MKLRHIALAAAVALTLTACGSDDSDSESTPTPTVEQTEDTAEAPESETLPVSITITDDVLGDTISVTQMVRDFAPSDTGSAVVEGGGEFVLLELDLVAGDQFSGGIQGGWKLVTADGELAGSATTILDEDLEAAGLTPLDNPSSGEAAKGWVAFQVNTRADAYQFEYKRQAATVIGQDTEIPEQIWTEALPTS
ncbi:MAG: hypothetical protein P1U38_07025 [Aeromicrobium sp.]|uniref:hypothetical protein n=1 Tax=Aeromicrobium sp. TaxID=1871063 RepID=UPI0025BD8D81|nr:hypothetical protein [Aeromicrobium sp.]MCK5891345.1 hypothetical protein [Aeromicrobium sp.]MDF1704508.1 hypothetical protein [Aeromicrobium sp.]